MNLCAPGRGDFSRINESSRFVPGDQTDPSEFDIVVMLQFIGGPHDGLSLPLHEIRRVSTLFSIPTQRGVRRFVIFPVLRD